MGSITHSDMLSNRTNEAPEKISAPTEHQGDSATVCRTFRLCAAHKLSGHPKCGKWHGHNYRVDVYIRGPIKHDGMVMDFAHLKRAFQPVMDRYDHTCLNDYPELAPPTAEKMALAIFHQMVKNLKDYWPVYVRKVRVWETDDCFAEVGK